LVRPEEGIEKSCRNVGNLENVKFEFV
jgi:hypothetical protein